MATKKRRLTTNAKPLGLETLPEESAAQINGGSHRVFGLVVNPKHHKPKKPIFGLIVHP